MKKTALILCISLALSPLCVSPAEARHRSHNHDDLSAGEAIAALLITGLVVAAIGVDSYDYVGSPWGVIDTEVSPKDCEVYIDGGYAGKARNFDGWPGYLPLEPGRYRIEFRYPGYQPYRAQVRVLSGRRLVIKKRLHLLGAGQAPPTGAPQVPPPEGRERGDDREDWRWEDGQQSDDRDDGRRGPDQGPASRPEPPEAQGPPPVAREDRDQPAPSVPPKAEGPAEMSELKLEIAPEDASVYLDGQFYVNGKDLEGGARAILLAPGEYKIEVVRPGYKTQSFTVVLGSEPRTLKIQMERQ